MSLHHWLLPALLTPWAVATPAPPPNVVIILTDDQGYHDVGFNGSTDIATPHLDSIARHGVRFDAGYVAYTVCSPSRAALLTGRYGQRFGYERNPRFRPEDPTAGLPLTETTLAASLQSVGYRTGIIGKWHLGAHPSLHPLHRGFDEFFGHLGGGHRYFPEEFTVTDPAQARSESDSYRVPILRDFAPTPTTGYLTDTFSDEAVAFVERHADQPFFLYLAYNAPHTPLQASEETLARVAHIADPRRRTYAAMVTAVDDGVGRLLEALRQHHLLDRTLIFFLSDNGGPTADNAALNTPFRGVKGHVWEGGHRVPFAMQWPGHIPAGLDYREPVSALDLFPTIAAATGAPLPTDSPLDGVNLLPFLRGEREGPPHDTLFLRMFDKGAYAARRGPWKLLIAGRGQPTRLFNLVEDPAETHDVAADHPEIVHDLQGRLERWESTLIEPVFEGLLSGPPRRP